MVNRKTRDRLFHDLNFTDDTQITHRLDSNSSNENLILLNNVLSHLNELYGESLAHLSIKYIFYNKIYKPFVEFCNNKNIFYMKGLTLGLIKEYVSIDAEKCENILFQIDSKLIDIEEAFSERFFYLDYLKAHYLELMKKEKVEKVFHERKYLLFNSYCRENNISYMSEIKRETLICFGFGKNIGSKKKYEINKRLKEYLVDIMDDDEKEYLYNYIKNVYSKELMKISIGSVFRESRYVTFKIFCNDRGVNNLYDLTLEIQNEFLNLYDTNDSKKKYFSKLLKNEYLRIVEKYSDSGEEIQIKEIYKNNRERKIIEEKYYKIVSIDDIFEYDYKAFRHIMTQLKLEGISNLYELVNYNKIKFKKLPGVGNKRYTEIKLLIEKKIARVNKIVDILYNEEFVLDDVIISIIKKRSTKEIFSLLDLNKYAEKYPNIKLTDYCNIKYRNIDDIKFAIMLIDVRCKLDSIIDLGKIIDEIEIEKFSKTEMLIFDKVILSRLECEEVSRQENIEINKVKKTLKNIIDKIDHAFEVGKFIDFLFFIYGDSKSGDFSLIEKLINKKDVKLIEIIKSNVVYFMIYDEDRNTINYSDREKELGFLYDELKKLPNYGDKNVLIEVIKNSNKERICGREIDDFIYGGLYKSILDKNGIILYESYYYKANISKIQLFEFYLRYFHTEPFRVNKENTQLYNEFLDKLGTGYKVNIRSIDGVKIRNKNLILTAPRTYSHIDLVGVDDVTQLHIKNILDNKLSKKKSVNALELYNKINEYYPDSVYNKHHLYSLIDYYFDDYQTSTGNSLDITRKGEKIPTKTDEIYNICKSNGSVMTIRKLIEITNWSNSRICNIIDNSNEVIKLGPYRCAIIRDLIDENIEREFLEEINKSFEDGYCFSIDFYKNNVKNNMVLNNFAIENAIYSHKEISSLIKYFSKDIFGNNNLLFKKDSEIRTIEDVIAKKYTGRITKNELTKFLKDNGYSKITLYKAINKLLERKLFVRISRDEYEAYSKFSVQKDIIQRIDEIAKKSINEKSFFIPKRHISELNSILRFEKYELNQFLITSILELIGYKLISGNKKNYVDEINVIVDKNSTYCDIDTLIYNILKNDYEGEMHRDNIHDFLMSKGFYSSFVDEYIKKIKREMYINKLISIDDDGIIELK